MTDKDLQNTCSTSELDLSSDDREFVLRLLNASCLSLVSVTSESEPTQNKETSLTSEDQFADKKATLPPSK